VVAVESAGLYANHLHLAPDRTIKCGSTTVEALGHSTQKYFKI